MNVMLLFMIFLSSRHWALDTAVGRHHDKWGSIVTKIANLAHSAIYHLPGTIIVIGANTGNNLNDPIWQVISTKPKQSAISAIMVEPIPHFHHRLAENLKRIGLSCSIAVNVAITATGDESTLYCTGMHSNGSLVEEFPHYVSQMCSSSLHSLYSIFKPDDRNGRELVKKYLMKYTVPGLTASDLISRYVKRAPVTMIQIDVEGFDDIVLRSLPLVSVGSPLPPPSPVHISPALLIYEDSHLPVNRVVLARQHMHALGYHTVASLGNTFAFKPSLLHAVTQTMGLEALGPVAREIRLNLSDALSLDLYDTHLPVSVALAASEQVENNDTIFNSTDTRKAKGYNSSRPGGIENKTVSGNSGTWSLSLCLGGISCVIVLFIMRWFLLRKLRSYRSSVSLPMSAKQTRKDERHRSF